MYLGFRSMYLVFKAMEMDAITYGGRIEGKEKRDWAWDLGNANI